MKALKNIKFLFMPDFWIMNKEYSKEWDKYLNELIDTGVFERISEYRHLIGGVDVWTSNYPYAFGFARGFTQSIAHHAKQFLN